MLPKWLFFISCYNYFARPWNEQQLEYIWNRNNIILSLQGITLLQDAGTSDDSGRASERLTGSSVAPRDPDSSRDRLSDVRI